MSNIRSISIVDYKAKQAEYFLSRVDVEGYDVFAAQCNCDAFASAARSITFAIQAVCRGIPGFDEWYAVEQEALKSCPFCRFLTTTDGFLITSAIHLSKEATLIL